MTRRAMRDNGYMDFKEEVCPAAYKEMLFTKEGSEGLTLGGLHIWPRGDHFIMALANRDGSFTGTIYMNKKGKNSFAELGKDRPKIEKFFQEQYPDCISRIGGMDRVVEQFINNGEGFLGTVRASKFNHGDKVMLLGDAAHAITPFFGQGTNCSFEDCLVLSTLWDENIGKANSTTSANVAHVFEEFDRLRRPSTNAIADMALENFDEMMVKVADPIFNLQKEVENIIENTYPENFRSRYAMVCYGGLGNVSYKAAFDLGVIQTGILKDLTKGLEFGPGQAQKVSMSKALELIEERLVPAQRALEIDLSTVNHELEVPEKMVLKSRL